jgi:hypothetical protein
MAQGQRIGLGDAGRMLTHATPVSGRFYETVAQNVRSEPVEPHHWGEHTG